MPIFLEPMFWPRADVWQDLQITNSSLPLPDKNKVGSNFYLEPFVQVSHTKDFSKIWHDIQHYHVNKGKSNYIILKTVTIFFWSQRWTFYSKLLSKSQNAFFWKIHSENFLENAQNDGVLYVNIVGNTE